MKRYFFTIIPLLLLVTLLNSQETIHRCSMDEKTKALYPTEQEYQQYLKGIKASFAEFKNAKNAKQSSTLITIPVHVIILHSPGQAIGTGTNFTMEHIQSQIDVLNEDFRRLNSDAEDTPDEFAAGDTEIEFCLAVVDPDGNETDGVTRFGTNQNMNSNENSIKNSTRWPRADYLNIWSAPNLGSLLGWAYRPTTGSLPNATLDGVVTAASAFGGPGYGTDNPYDLGRTTTHEVGHYLGLDHVWGGNGGCGQDDGISDTPNQNSSRFGCPSHPAQSCGSNDMFMNYMDYVNDACMNAFTVEQGEYMQLILNTSRSSIAESSSIVCIPSVPLGAETVNVQNVLCNGESNGSIQIQGIGGLAPYLYSINNGPFQSSPLFENLAAGSYLMTVSDASDNTFSYQVQVTQPNPLIATTVQVQDNLCAGDESGFVFFTINGGEPPYAVDGGNISGNQVSYSNLAAGMYDYVISDGNNCVSFYSVVIDEPTPIGFTIETQTEVGCNGESDGSISFEIIGGSPDYTVNFQNNEIQGDVIENLAAGTYEIEIIDEVGCSIIEEFMITQPNELTSNVVVDQQESCLNSADGIVSVSIEGGTEPFTILLDGIEQSGSILENVSAGSHDVNILDANNCSSLSTFEIIEGYEIDVVVFETTASSCGPEGSGTATIVSQGGEGLITYLIIETGESNSTGLFENLAGGQYSIQGTDENGCSDIVDVMIDQTSNSQLEVIESTLFICNGDGNGSITVELGNPMGNPMYSLDNSTFQESGFFDNLSEGNYTAYAIDDNNCLVTTNFTVTENPAITYEYDAINPMCFGSEDGSIQVEANGGANGFIYTLEGNDVINETGTFELLGAGEHFIVITDENGCENSFSFILDEPAEIYSEVTSNPTSCFGVSDGFLTFETSNNQGDVDYDVIDEDGNSYDFEALFSGDYSVIVSDANGCSITLPVTVEDAEPISFEIIDQTPANCDGTVRGTISFQATSGESPYTYTVGQNTNDTGEFDNFNTGTYELTIIDNTGCTRVVDFFIDQLPSFDYEISALFNISCYDFADGAVTITTDGLGIFNYNLNGEINTSGEFNNLAAGEYPLEIIDETGCVVYDTIIITEPSELLINSVDQSSNGQGLVNIEIDAIGGIEPLMYSIDGENYQESSSFINLPDGDYTIYVKDANDCITSFESTIVDNVLISAPTFNVYPNPFYSTIVISQIDFFSNQAQFNVLSIDGQLIDQFRISDFKNKKYEIDFFTLPSGMYIIQAIDGENTVYKKVIKQ